MLLTVLCKLYILLTCLFTFVLSAGAPSKKDSLKQHWSSEEKPDSRGFSRQLDTTYGCSYSLWSPEHYTDMQS